jgi:hypothetical protein
VWDDLDAACAVEDLDKEVVKELGRYGDGSDVGGLHGEKADDLDEEVIASAKEALHQVIELDLRYLLVCNFEVHNIHNIHNIA